jgi:hypothetical protein
MARRLPRTEPLPAAGLPRHRAIVALDIERSTSRPDPGGHRHPGWIRIPGQAARNQVTEIASYRQPA